LYFEKKSKFVVSNCGTRDGVWFGMAMERLTSGSGSEFAGYWHLKIAYAEINEGLLRTAASGGE
jgi:hypothetical protein